MSPSSAAFLITGVLLAAHASSLAPAPPARYAPQLLNAYFSGTSLSTMAGVGLNSVSLAFFSPAALAQENCNFTDPSSPCVSPAAGGGEYTLQWALASISAALPLLAPSASPAVPLFLLSFGGANAGGGAWEQICSDPATARLFGSNAAALVKTLAAAFPSAAFGVDLDIEGTTTTLPHAPELIAAYRAAAPYPAFPLQLCALSGLADPSSSDYFKLALLTAAGPAQGGLSHLLLMVDNVDVPCAAYAGWWNATALSFLPPYARVGGCWGNIYPSFTLHGPGCTDGASPLYPWMQREAGLSVWEWWSGDTTALAAVIAAVRAPPAEFVKSEPHHDRAA